MKLSDLIDIALNLIANFFNGDVTSGFEILTIFGGSACPRSFLLTKKDIEFKISGMIDKRL